jgi:hypothetical protein
MIKSTRAALKSGPLAPHHYRVEAIHVPWWLEFSEQGRSAVRPFLGFRLKISLTPLESDVTNPWKQGKTHGSAHQISTAIVS